MLPTRFASSVRTDSVMPSQVDVFSLKAKNQESFVKSRVSKHKYIPTAGQTTEYSSGAMIEIQINNANWLDMMSHRLVFSLLASNGIVSSGVAWIKQFQLDINGQTVCNIDNAHRIISGLVACTATRDYYEQQLSRSGFYWHSKDPQLNASALPNDYSGKLGVIAVAQSGTALYAIDFSALGSIFAQQKLFPSPIVSSVVIRLYLEDPLKCMTASTIDPGDIYSIPPTPSNATYTLSNVSFQIDSVILADDFNKLFMAYVAKLNADESSEGLAISCDAFYCQQLTGFSGGSTSSTTLTQLISRNAKYLKGCLVQHVQNVDMGGAVGTGYSVAPFEMSLPIQTDCHLVINGQQYPQTISVNAGEVYCDTAVALGTHMDNSGGSLQTYFNTVYYADNPNIVSASFASGLTFSGFGLGVVNQIGVGLPNGFVYVNTEDIIQSDGQSLDGVASVGGGGITLYVSGFASRATTLFATIHYAQIIGLKFTSVRIYE